MTDEEMAEQARAFLAALRAFRVAFAEYGAPQLDPCDPLRILFDDACWADAIVQAELDGADRRIKQARIDKARRERLPHKGLIVL